MKREKCSCCMGKGMVMRYPYYSTVMPELQEMRCEKCNGTGYVWLRTDNSPLVNDNFSTIEELKEQVK